MIKKITAAGLLSFGPEGMELPLEKLNVLIGANGCGKSNLLEILALLKAAPTIISKPIKQMGGVKEWLWKGTRSKEQASFSATVHPKNLQTEMAMCHSLSFVNHGGRFEITDERIEHEKPLPGHDIPYLYYAYWGGHPVLNSRRENERHLDRGRVKLDQSILSQIKDPDRYPEIACLQEYYDGIALYRNWSCGPNSPVRRGQSTTGPTSHLLDGGENLFLALNRIWRVNREELLESLKELYDGIENLFFDLEDGGNMMMYIDEGGRQIPASRLSDGTLRYLSLLAILLHPEPQEVIAVEEPELGLHPDVIPHIAKLLVDASERTQLIVTTHSNMLVDALSSKPENVVVCAKEEGSTSFNRLDSKDLQIWLDKYSLGDLWSRGEIGGNRW